MAKPRKGKSQILRETPEAIQGRVSRHRPLREDFPGEQYSQYLGMVPDKEDLPKYFELPNRYIAQGGPKEIAVMAEVEGRPIALNRRVPVTSLTPDEFKYQMGLKKRANNSFLSDSLAARANRELDQNLRIYERFVEKDPDVQAALKPGKGQIGMFAEQPKFEREQKKASTARRQAARALRNDPTLESMGRVARGASKAMAVLTPAQMIIRAAADNPSKLQEISDKATELITSPSKIPGEIKAAAKEAKDLVKIMTGPSTPAKRKIMGDAKKAGETGLEALDQILMPLLPFFKTQLQDIDKPERGPVA